MTLWHIRKDTVGFSKKERGECLLFYKIYVSNNWKTTLNFILFTVALYNLKFGLQPGLAILERIKTFRRDISSLSVKYALFILTFAKKLFLD